MQIMSNINIKIKKVVSEVLKEAVNETSRRQKADAAINRKNPNIQTLAILTSENPRFDSNTDGKNVTNADRRENLEKDLKLGHYAWFPVKGQYGGKEKSYIIYNISLEDALHLGRKFGQESIIFNEGDKCQYWEQSGDGNYEMTHERDISQKIDMSDADDYYTQVSRKNKFQIPFFDGSDENMEAMNESMKYVNKVINSRVKNLNEAQRRIDSSLNATSPYNRYCNRGQLYGNKFQW